MYTQVKPTILIQTLIITPESVYFFLTPNQAIGKPMTTLKSQAKQHNRKTYNTTKNPS